MGHGIVKCRPCGKIISRCRCRNHRVIAYDVCATCRARGEVDTAPDAAAPVAHIILTPWPIAAGVRTWCGRHAHECGSDTFATMPEFVTCAPCRKAARIALANLMAYVPGLPEDT